MARPPGGPKLGVWGRTARLNGVAGQRIAESTTWFTHVCRYVGQPTDAQRLICEVWELGRKGIPPSALLVGPAFRPRLSHDGNTAQAARSTSERMKTPTQCKAVTATLLALTLPGCAFQMPWASPSAIAMHPSPEAPSSPQNRAAESSQFPLADDDVSITGSVGDQVRPGARVKRHASCDRRRAVSVGMTREQVYASCWGRPTSIDASTTGRYRFELLVYQGFDYVFLEDGVVTSVQVSSR